MPLRALRVKRYIMKKNLIVLAVVALAVLAVVCTVDIQSVDEYYLTHLEDISSDSQTVTLSVNCSLVFDNLDLLDESLKRSDIIPKDGIILPPTEYVLRKDDTVFDLLNRALRYNKIHFDYSGNSDSSFQPVYIRGIANIYEYDCGDLSGWMYSVNGQFPQNSCSDYKPSDGDVIEWQYTCSLGKDLGDEYFSE